MYPNGMLNSDEVRRNAYIGAAKELGAEHARDAASWCVDVRECARVLAMLREGDPAAYDYLPRSPNLSGECADDPTPMSIYEEITGERNPEPPDANYAETGALIDALADAYEEGVQETFTLECERLLIEFCE